MGGINTNSNVRNLIEFEGEYYTKKELAELHGIKPNTFVCRYTKRGWSLRAALGLEKQEPKIVLVNEQAVEYKGKISQEEINRMVKMHNEGSSTIRIGKELGIDPSQVFRMLLQGGLVGKQKAVETSS